MDIICNVNTGDLCNGLKGYRCPLLHLWENNSVSNCSLKVVKNLITFLSHMMVFLECHTIFFFYRYISLQNLAITWRPKHGLSNTPVLDLAVH